VHCLGCQHLEAKFEAQGLPLFSCSSSVGPPYRLSRVYPLERSSAKHRRCLSFRGMSALLIRLMSTHQIRVRKSWHGSLRSSSGYDTTILARAGFLMWETGSCKRTNFETGAALPAKINPRIRPSFAMAIQGLGRPTSRKRGDL